MYDYCVDDPINMIDPSGLEGVAALRQFMQQDGLQHAFRKSMESDADKDKAREASKGLVEEGLDSAFPLFRFPPDHPRHKAAAESARETITAKVEHAAGGYVDMQRIPFTSAGSAVWKFLHHRMGWPAIDFDGAKAAFEERRRKRMDKNGTSEGRREKNGTSRNKLTD